MLTSPVMNRSRGSRYVLRQILCVFLGLLACTSARAQEQDCSFPDVGMAVGAFLTARDWTTKFDLPALEDPASKVEMPCVSGVSIILRHQARILGEGQDWSGDALMLRRAMGRALGEVLSDASVSNVPEQMRNVVGGRLTIQLELAGKPTPTLGANFDQVVSRLTPGIDGVALRRGNDWQYEFPSHLLSWNTARNLDQAFLRMAADLGLPAKDLPQLTRIDRVGAYRFKTFCLVQGDPAGTPFQVIRGDEIVPPGPLDVPTLVQAVDRLIQHIEASIGRELADGTVIPIGLRGDYRSSTDQYRPLIAPSFDQAMVAMALARLSRCDSLPETTRHIALDLAEQVIMDLAIKTSSEDDALVNPATCAAVVLAAAQAPSNRDNTTTEFVEGAKAVVRSSFAGKDGFVLRSDDHKETLRLPASKQALLAAAMATLFRQGRYVDHATAREAIDAAWKSGDEGRTIELSPWIIMAEQIIAGQSSQLAHVDELKSLIDDLDGLQVLHSPEDAGVEGGYAVPSRRGTPTLPDSQSLRFGAAKAMAGKEERIGPVDPGDLMMRLQGFARFTRQLTARPSSAWAFPAPDRALGGIRESLIDNDQPVAAQAMGIMALAELLDAMSATPRPAK